ncbi:MAG: hypothetical protein SFZ03_04435 [Candidatus Melainabacteria bacterium]|nr:hypothetical protein [Candidatus Melainabacteria bacterium]
MQWSALRSAEHGLWPVCCVRPQWSVRDGKVREFSGFSHPEQADAFLKSLPPAREGEVPPIRLDIHASDWFHPSVMRLPAFFDVFVNRTYVASNDAASNEPGSPDALYAWQRIHAVNVAEGDDRQSQKLKELGQFLKTAAQAKN